LEFAQCYKCVSLSYLLYFLPSVARLGSDLRSLSRLAPSPAFDVTPAELIDAVVTETRVVENVGGKINMARS
jgi:translation initiation factor 2B subunit (eIF-2B alpha/beta/delta family)